MQAYEYIARLQRAEPEAQLGRLRLDLLHADRLPRLPRVRRHADAAVHHAAPDEGPLHAASATSASRARPGTGTSSTSSGSASTSSSTGCERRAGRPLRPRRRAAQRLSGQRHAGRLDPAHPPARQDAGEQQPPTARPARASARIMLPLFGLPSRPSRSMKTPAQASAPRMPTKATPIRILHGARLSRRARPWPMALSAPAAAARDGAGRDAGRRRAHRAPRRLAARPRGAEDGAAGRARRARRAAAARRRRRWRATPADAPRAALPPVRLRGRWLAERTVFLDNRQMDGRVGFYVVTPLRSTAGRGGAGAARLGRRATSPTARGLPRVADAGRARSRSRARSPRRRRGCTSSPARPAGRSGRISTSPRSRARPACRCCRCRSLQRDAAGSAGDGLLRQWPPPATDVQKHYGYAFQWFALGALMAGLYVWFQLVRPRLRRALTRRRSLSFTVHSLPRPDARAGAARRTARGRWLKMLLVLLVCAAPVVASYLTYFVIRPEGRTNYSELIQPPRPLPATLPLTDLRRHAGRRRDAERPVAAGGGAGGACDAACEKRALAAAPAARDARPREGPRRQGLADHRRRRAARARRSQAIGAPAARRRARAASLPRPCCAPRALAAGSRRRPGSALEDHLYIVDPMRRLDDARAGRARAGASSSATSRSCCAPRPAGTRPGAD